MNGDLGAYFKQPKHLGNDERLKLIQEINENLGGNKNSTLRDELSKILMTSKKNQDEKN